MVKVNVKQDVSIRPKFILIVLGFALVMAFVIFGADKISNIFQGTKGDSSNTSQMESILSKEENKLTIDEWKKIADYRAQEFFDCTKYLANDLESAVAYGSCYREYNNARVLFQLGVDEKANLNFEQQKQVKTYWSQTEDEMREKVIKLMGENEKKLRPNKYNE
jgi:hypothetical protein